MSIRRAVPMMAEAVPWMPPGPYHPVNTNYLTPAPPPARDAPPVYGPAASANIVRLPLPKQPPVIPGDSVVTAPATVPGSNVPRVKTKVRKRFFGGSLDARLRGLRSIPPDMDLEQIYQTHYRNRANAPIFTKELGSPAQQAFRRYMARRYGEEHEYHPWPQAAAAPAPPGGPSGGPPRVRGGRTYRTLPIPSRADNIRDLLGGTGKIRGRGIMEMLLRTEGQEKNRLEEERLREEMKKLWDESQNAAKNFEPVTKQWREELKRKVWDFGSIRKDVMQQYADALKVPYDPNGTDIGNINFWKAFDQAVKNGWNPGELKGPSSGMPSIFSGDTWKSAFEFLNTNPIIQAGLNIAKAIPGAGEVAEGADLAIKTGDQIANPKSKPERPAKPAADPFAGQPDTHVNPLHQGAHDAEDPFADSGPQFGPEDPYMYAAHVDPRAGDYLSYYQQPAADFYDPFAEPAPPLNSSLGPAPARGDAFARYGRRGGFLPADGRYELCYGAGFHRGRRARRRGVKAKSRRRGRGIDPQGMTIANVLQRSKCAGSRPPGWMGGPSTIPPWMRPSGWAGGPGSFLPSAKAGSGIMHAAGTHNTPSHYFR